MYAVCVLTTTLILASVLTGEKLQKSGEILVRAATMRTISRKTTTEFFPIAVYSRGKYRSAESVVAGDVPRACALKVGGAYHLFRNGSEVGKMKIAKVVTEDTAVGSYRVGLGDWHIDKKMWPSENGHSIPGEEALASSMYFSMDDKAVGAPFRVFIGINAVRPNEKGFLAATAAEQEKIEKAMGAAVAAKAKKEKIDLDHLKNLAFASFDVDGDGVKEYAALYKDVDSDSPGVGIFLVGRLRGGKFETLFLEPAADVYPVPFDVLDIDGDGMQEIICEAGVYEGCGFSILSKAGGKFKKVFEEIEFGV